MLPAQKNKIDLSSLNDQEKQLFSKYGQMPAKKNNLLAKTKERKYFDSGDYALAKAGKTAEDEVGTIRATPENVPHSSPSTQPVTLSGTSPTQGITPISLAASAEAFGNPDHVGVANSPVKESRLSRQFDSELRLDQPVSQGTSTHPTCGSFSSDSATAPQPIPSPAK